MATIREIKRALKQKKPVIYFSRGKNGTAFMLNTFDYAVNKRFSGHNLTGGLMLADNWRLTKSRAARSIIVNKPRRRGSIPQAFKAGKSLTRKALRG